MRTGLTKQEKTTDIWFDEKDPLIHIRTHKHRLEKASACIQPPLSGDLASRLTQTRKRGCMEFDIEKGRFSFRLTAHTARNGGKRRGGMPERQRRRQAEIELKCS